ncbi:hypothetical protein ACFL3U_02885 [Pseudomonadota bacterium]
MYDSNDSMRCSSLMKLNCFFMIALLLCTPLVWANGEGVVGDTAKSEVVGTSAIAIQKEEQERNMFNDEARDMPGIVFGSIIVNSILVTVFFWLLWREWKKHEKRPKPKSDLSSESEEP